MLDNLQTLFLVVVHGENLRSLRIKRVAQKIYIEKKTKDNRQSFFNEKIFLNVFSYQ